MSKETPIAYSTPMVKSLLDGRKKMTRRICKHQHWSFSELNDVNSNGITKKTDRSVSCPYGQVGDLLWVREEHLITFENHFWSIEYKDEAETTLYYKKLSLNLNKRLAARKTLGKWQRARFLPKELSRLWLKITNIKVERLQDIIEEDAIKEGILRKKVHGTVWYDDYLQPNTFPHIDPCESFRSLWISINGLESWNANPWVWAIEFEVLSTTGKPENL